MAWGEVLGAGSEWVGQQMLLWRDLALAPWRPADIAVFHQFAPPPGGGGHQFLRALSGALSRAGYRIENNTISRVTRACLFNSFNFEPRRLRRFRRPTCRMVHRVDGPITVYRGRDDGSDRLVLDFNHEFADATIFQSAYSLNRHREMGMAFREPVIVRNAVDPAVFHPGPVRLLPAGEKTRLLAVSWSDNLNKGFATYKWLDTHLDWDRFTLTFVGRSPVAFQRIEVLPPTDSHGVAALMRAHDLFVSASRFESCPNAVLEALACGLPVLYHDSGGSGEVVGAAGVAFREAAEIPELLDRMCADYGRLRALIRLPTLDETALAYLRVLGL